MPDSGRPDLLVKDLAEACSQQAHAANRTWLVAMGATLLVLLPRVPESPGGPVKVQLPLDLGTIEGALAYPIAFCILAVLVVAISVAHAQHVRADRLANQLLDDLPKSVHGKVNVSARQLFDIQRESGLTRVAPLAQMFTAPRLGFLRAVLYILLKLGSLVVLFGAPGVALVLGFQQVRTSGVGRGWLVALGGLGLLAVMSLVIVTVVEIVSTAARIKSVYRAPD